MSYSISTFTVEINGVPAVAFQAKWHSEADEICRAWANRHWDELITRGRHAGLEFQPTIKLRLAHADEKEAYRIGSNGAEHYDGVTVVYLVDMTAPPWASRE
ncbi:MAG: hypothetical protein JO141_22040 [Bradyrhizobium sp.]|nr:hypothetical protein [Bradyrhizobium sp.]